MTQKIEQRDTCTSSSTRVLYVALCMAVIVCFGMEIEMHSTVRKTARTIRVVELRARALDLSSMPKQKRGTTQLELLHTLVVQFCACPRTLIGADSIFTSLPMHRRSRVGIRVMFRTWNDTVRAVPQYSVLPTYATHGTHIKERQNEV